MVTPTIVAADSTLDLSFTASTSGTATITVRAADSGGLTVDDVFTVTVNAPPTVAAAIADTTVADSSPAVDNYRDLKAVFTDTEDGSALTYSIESNTNTGLVTPTIVVADSTLDLSFTASNSGTATITIRATDSGGLFVEDVFTVTVSCPAGSICWDGGAGGGNPEWSNGLNWTGDAVPGPAALVVFNGLSSNPATFDVADQIGSLTIEASYTGTITLSANIDLDLFTQSGGTLNATSAQMTLDQDTDTSLDIFTNTGGTFNPGTGLVRINTGRVSDGTTVFTINVPDLFQFNNLYLDIYSNSYNNYVEIQPSGANTIVVNNDLTIGNNSESDGNRNLVIKGAWQVKGDLIIGGDAAFGSDPTATITMNGSANQEYIFTGDAFGGTAPNLIINNPGNTVSAATGTTDFRVRSLDVQNGTFASPTGTLTMHGLSDTDMTLFKVAAPGAHTENGTTKFLVDKPSDGLTTFTIDLVDGFTFSNPVILDQDNPGSGNEMTIRPVASRTIVAGSDLTFGTSGQSNKGMSPDGLWEVQGNLIIGDNFNNGNGTASVSFTGANAQTITIAAGAEIPDGLFTINKTNPTDTVTLASALNLSGSSQDLTITQGVLALGAFDLTVADVLTVDANGDITCTTGTVSALSETGAGLPYSCGANTIPTVASAIPDTTVADSNPAIDNYRDLKAVFTDTEDGSALTYSIESNTNTGLVTATFIPADSTLDLSFTASNSGTATITVRATDSGGLWVEDVFTVTVSCPAGSVCWDGGAGGGNPEWSNGLNWTGDVVPGSSALVVFNGLSSNPATFNAVDQIGSLTIEASYTGTITQGTGAVLTLTDYTQNGGTFLGGDANIVLNSDVSTFTINGGDFTATSATIKLAGSMDVSGADSFTHNSGVITARNLTNFQDITINGGTHNLFDLTVDVFNSGDLIVTGNLNVLGTLTVDIDSDSHIMGGTIEAKGPVTVTSGSTSGDGTGTIAMSGITSQTLTSSAGPKIPNLVINSTGGTVTFSGTITIERDFTYTQGAFNTSATTFIFDNDDTFAQSTITAGSFEFDNLTFIQTTGGDATIVGTATVNGDLIINDDSDSKIDGGILAVKGNVTQTSGQAGNAQIQFIGGNAQSITYTAGSWPTGLFTINKTNATDTVTLASALNLSGSGQDLTITQGVLALGAYDLTVADVLTVDANGDITCTTGTVSALSETGAGLPYSCVADVVAPDDVTDLATGTVTSSSVVLSWTAPGDDASTGTATTYDVRYSTSPIITGGDWDAAAPASGEPSPQIAGSSESFTVTGLPSNSTTYYFALKTSDEASNESAISNLPSGTTGDVTYQKGDGQGTDSEVDDARLLGANATTNYGSLDRLDVDTGPPDEHSVVKFPNIFGGGGGQIPLGSSITSATLTLEVNNPGDDVLVYQLIESWDEATVTWNEASTGVSWTDAGADGPGSRKATADGTMSALPAGSYSVDVTASVQNWSFGELNEGWLLKDTGGDGVDIRSSEYTPAAQGPRLTVTYTANTAPTVASAIADTTVFENNSAIDNYRDLKAVFTDANEGSGLTYSIESNTNTGLVTASIIPADSTLDLSFTASTSGTATITIRATDSGSLFVDDVFTVTVNADAVLLGRYWFNEAPSGQAVATVLDDQASPVNLSVTYDTLAWRLDAGHRGLGVPVAGRTNNMQHAGIASAAVEGTKYKTNLNGATAATFVVVAEWEGGWSDRMAGFQRPGGGRILLALTDAGGGLEFRTDSDLSNPRMLWPSQGWDDGVRRVFHFVYDTDHPTDSLRMRLYVDGVDQGIPPSILGGIPPIGDGLNWGFTDIELIALNEPDFTNGFPGSVFYMAVHDGVMTDAEITSDVAALLADDDNITYAVDVTLNGVDSLPKLPSNGTSYPYKYTVTNNSTVLEDFDLFGYPGDTLATFLTVDSIIGPNVTGGATADSARITGVPASGVDSAFVWFSVTNTAAGALDSLYLNSRSLSDTTVSDPGWAFVEVVKPNLAVGKAVSPNGTQLPGTELTYTVTITNDGSDDAAGVVVLDSLPEELDFKVGTVVNNLPSGVTATVEYSNDAGSSWTYTPVSAGCSAPTNFDSCVTHIRWTLDSDLSYVGPDNTGNVEFVARIQ